MKILHTVETYIATALLVLMALVVTSGAVELAYEILKSMVEPPGFFVGTSEMFLVALTAVTRKIVIFDAANVEPLVIFGIGFLIISLSTGYYLLKTRHKSAAAT